MDRCQSSSCPSSNPLHGLQLPHVVTHLSADEPFPPWDLVAERTVWIICQNPETISATIYWNGIRLPAFRYNRRRFVHSSTTSQTDRRTQTPEAARLLSQLRRLVLSKLRSHYNISHQRWISWPVSMNQCDKCTYVLYITPLCFFLSFGCQQCSLADWHWLMVHWETHWTGVNWGRKIN